MRLSDKQALFANKMAALMVLVPHLGYRVRYGDAYRDPRASFPYGRSKSLHKSRLAVDLILDKWDEDSSRWVYCRKSEDYRVLGEIWELMGGSWGGRFNDGNHFSLEHQGRR